LLTLRFIARRLPLTSGDTSVHRPRLWRAIAAGLLFAIRADPNGPNRLGMDKDAIACESNKLPIDLDPVVR
jgi:hypothetical protein